MVKLCPLLFSTAPCCGANDAPSKLPSQTLVRLPAKSSATVNVWVIAPLPTTRLSSRMGEEANVPPGAVPLKSQQWITVWADALAEKARINAESMRVFKGTWIKKW